MNEQIINATITRINKETKTSSSSGRPFTTISMIVSELPNTWINGFGDKESKLWKEGDNISIVVFDKEWKGKTYKNFRSINASDVYKELKKTQEWIKKNIIK